MGKGGVFAIKLLMVIAPLWPAPDMPTRAPASVSIFDRLSDNAAERSDATYTDRGNDSTSLTTRSHKRLTSSAV